MMRFPRPGSGARVLAALGFLAAAGCDGAGSGVAIPDPPARTATLELRIGSVDDGASILTYVSAMDVAADGRIYSAHRQESSILVHDRTGERVARIGGEGEGPGEFRGLGAIGFIGDTLWAFDYQLYRASYFTPAGELLRTLRVPVTARSGPEARMTPRPVGLLPDGRVFGTEPAWSRDIAAGTLTQVAAFGMDTLGEVRDTLYVREPSVWAIQDPSGARSYGSYRSQPFDDAPIFVHSPRRPAYVVVRRRVVADTSSTFRVARVTFTGDTVFDRAFGYDPVQIDPSYADSLVESFAARVAGSDFGTPPPLRDARQWAGANLYLPAHYPPVETGIVGLDGTVWLRMGGAGQDAEMADWLVLDPAGEPLARVTLPRELQVQVARGDRVWGWGVDDLDVPYIYRYGIARTGDG